MAVCKKCKKNVINLMSHGLCSNCYKKFRYPEYLKSKTSSIPHLTDFEKNARENNEGNVIREKKAHTFPVLIFETIKKTDKKLELKPVVIPVCRSCGNELSPLSKKHYCESCKLKKQEEYKIRQKMLRKKKIKPHLKRNVNIEEQKTKQRVFSSLVFKLFMPSCKLCNKKVSWTEIVGDKYCESCWNNRQKEINENEFEKNVLKPHKDKA